MANEDKKLVTWDNKVGMATVTGVLQIIILIVTIAVAFNSVKDAVDNSRAAVTELKNIVSTMQLASAANAERVTRLEEQAKAQSSALERIERKVDALTSPVRR